MPDRNLRIQEPDGGEYEVLESDLKAHPDAKVLGVVGQYGNLLPYEPKASHKAEEPAKEASRK